MSKKRNSTIFRKNMINGSNTHQKSKNRQQKAISGTKKALHSKQQKV